MIFERQLDVNMPSRESILNKNFIKSATLLLVSIIVSVLLCDLLLRAYETITPDIPSQPDKDTVDLVKLRYNDSAVDVKKDAHEYRILSFGDSFAKASVLYPFSYHGIAQNGLNNLGLDTKIRIVNLGIEEIGIYHYIALHKYWGSVLEYDAVVFNIFLGNDITRKVRPSLRTMPLKFRTMADLGKIPHKYPLRLMDYSYAYYMSRRGRKMLRESPGDNRFVDRGAYYVSEDKYYRIMRDQLINFSYDSLTELENGYRALIYLVQYISDVRKQGKETLIMVSPNELQVTPGLQARLATRYHIDIDEYDLDLPSYLIKELVSRVDPEIPVLDLCEPLRRATLEGKDLYYETDTHWGIEGNELVGNQLAHFVATYWLSEHIDKQEIMAHLPEVNYELNAAIESTELRIRALEAFLRPLIADESAKKQPTASEETEKPRNRNKKSPLN